MPDKPKKWIICPVCGNRLIKYAGGDGSAEYEFKCKGKYCGNLIKIYSAGKTAKL
jgi:hypothetical protein